jgi:hypothetical protein
MRFFHLLASWLSYLPCVRHLCKLACTVLTVAALLPFFSGVGFAQGEGDPTALLRVAVDKLTEGKQAKTRFTYLDENHTLNFNDKGRLTADYKQLFEVTYIADLQYERLMEINGRALEEDEQASEQKRYDKAVRDRAELDDKARAKLQHQMFKNAGVDVAKLTTDYRNTVVGREMIGGIDCLVIDSTPLSDAQHKHYRVWLDTAEGRMTRLRFDQLSDDGDMLQGGSGVLLWVYMDGTPLLSEVHVDANVKNGKDRVRVVTHHVYSRFRKFSVSSTIVPNGPDTK